MLLVQLGINSTRHRMITYTYSFIESPFEW
jgi:hypothetical protein